MRQVLALVVLLALALLPVGGRAMAAAAEAATPPCHSAPVAPQPEPEALGKACAEHCLLQIVAPRPTQRVDQPAIANAVAAPWGSALAPGRLRAAEGPEPPPPRA